MSSAAQIRTYAGFLSGLPHFVRNPISLEDAKAAIEQRLASRETAFLRFAETTLFASPVSPYVQLFRLAGCARGDLVALVRTRGLDAGLLALRAAGVYVSFAEFKGRTPLVRDGHEIPVKPSDFANPFLSRRFTGKTSGSTGVATSASIALGHLAIQSEHRLLALHAHGLVGAPSAIWRPILPAGSGLNNVLRGARIGESPLRWFVPEGDAAVRPAFRYRLATAAAIAVGRASGVRLPFPEMVPFSDAVRIARWMSDQRDAHGRVWLNTTVSCALRVALAAHADRIDLHGATFQISGEPATTAKIDRIRASGAGFFTDYGTVETGRMAVGCAHPNSESDLHLLSDIFAIVPWSRSAGPSDRHASSFHVTTFTPESPTLLLNVEFDDEGVIDQRPCGCPLEALGFRTHLRDIRSYGRLTGEGVTLVGSDMVRILEEVLPTQFGGSPLDYQLVEEEDAVGFTRLTLVANPDIAAGDEALREAVFSALTRAGGAAGMARALWQQAGTLQVRRSQPHVTERGKQPSFRVSRRRQVSRQ
jgi:hypothetical protein